MRSKWAAQRAANQPSKGKIAQYDAGNKRSARRILESPEQHPAFMVDWARRFQRRRAEERTTKKADCGIG
jgi:hypothetical protein